MQMVANLSRWLIHFNFISKANINLIKHSNHITHKYERDFVLKYCVCVYVKYVTSQSHVECETRHVGISSFVHVSSKHFLLWVSMKPIQLVFYHFVCV
jgi:hypothetical protein